MDLLAPLIAYSVALSIAAVIPGPGVAGLVGQSLGNGLQVSLFFLAGIALGDVVYLTIAIAGLAAIAQLFSGALLAIKVLGGLYLVYLASKFWRNEAGLTHVRKAGSRRGLKTFLSGFALTLGNPKTIIFYLALLPTVIDLGAVGLSQWAALSVLTVAVLFVTLLPYALLASGARTMMTRAEALQKLNRLAGAIIGGAGVFILGQAATAVVRRA
ncbi:LysE family translocator [Leisingera sp. ANG59]|uniref:LysE family translocator n=1 Tax=Leisingera sp. ANG59 TaxID=2675221 RepID=UPI0015730B14|nr:LysE family translocator [Leisingera sp. ANG59]NSY40070.1 LysE family translocator [Leisingera sp. ANG59]